MQKHVNFEPAGVGCERVASRLRHCQAGAASVSRRGSAVTVVAQAPRRPRAAVNHARTSPQTIRPTRRAATPVHFLSPPPRPPHYSAQVFTTYPSLVEAIQMKTAEMENYQQEEPERQRRPPEPCACRRCASRTLASARQSTTSVRCFRNNIVQYTERGTMTAITNDAECETLGTQNPNPHSRVISVQRSEVSSVRSASSSHSSRASILKRPSQLTGLNYIKYQAEQPERDLHEAESFPQTQSVYYEEEGYLNGYLDPGGRYPAEKAAEYPSVPYGLGPAEVSVGRERPCKCCLPQRDLDREGIPFSHRFSGSRYHKRCAQPVAEEFGFYKTTTLQQPPQQPPTPPQPWYPVTKGSNVFVKARPDGVRRPRRVLSSERNIEMYIGQEDVDHMIRRNRYY